MPPFQLLPDFSSCLNKVTRVISHTCVRCSPRACAISCAHHGSGSARVPHGHLPASATAGLLHHRATTLGHGPTVLCFKRANRPVDLRGISCLILGVHVGFLSFNRAMCSSFTELVHRVSCIFMVQIQTRGKEQSCRDQRKVKSFHTTAVKYF